MPGEENGVGELARMTETHEGKRALAVEMALEAGALAYCGSHDSVFRGGKTLEHVYRTAQTDFSHVHCVFRSQDEMREIIREVILDHDAGECPDCRKLRNESV
jgi:hypothetical protein